MKDLPEHSGGNYGIDPQQPEAMVVMLHLIDNLLPNGFFNDGFFHCWTINGAPFFQLLVFVFQGLQRFFYDRVIVSGC